MALPTGVEPVFSD